MQVDAHKDAVSLFERYSKGWDNADLKAWAGKTLPALKHHLEMAKIEPGKIEVILVALLASSNGHCDQTTDFKKPVLEERKTLMSLAHLPSTLNRSRKNKERAMSRKATLAIALLAGLALPLAAFAQGGGGSGGAGGGGGAGAGGSAGGGAGAGAGVPVLAAAVELAAHRDPPGGGGGAAETSTGGNVKPADAMLPKDGMKK